MSRVFQNIDPPPPSPPGECVPPPLLRGEGTLAGRRGGWGVNILEDARHTVGLASYSNNLSTSQMITRKYCSPPPCLFCPSTFIPEQRICIFQRASVLRELCSTLQKFAFTYAICLIINVCGLAQLRNSFFKEFQDMIFSQKSHINLHCGENLQIQNSRQH